MKTIVAVMIFVLPALTYAHTPLRDPDETIKPLSSVKSDAEIISATTANAAVTQRIVQAGSDSYRWWSIHE